MDDLGTSTRLRNACDACHQLKRKCSGTTPCEYCAQWGSSCVYSLTSRLGRPRGSRSRRNVNANGDSTLTPTATQSKSPAVMRRPSNSPPSSTAPTTTILRDAVRGGCIPDYWVQPPPVKGGFVFFPASSAGGSADSDMAGMEASSNSPQNGNQCFHAHGQGNNNNNNNLNDAADMQHLVLHFDDFDSASFDMPFVNTMEQSPGATTSFLNTISNFSPTLGSSPSLLGDMTPPSAAPSLAVAPAFAQQQERQTQEQSLPPHHRPQGKGSRQPPLPDGPPTCQCIPGLSSLLHEPKRDGDMVSPAGLDDVLCSVSEALGKWCALARCPRCQAQDDDGETLLLAALSLRRVVAQLDRVGCRPGTQGWGGEGEGGERETEGSSTGTSTGREQQLSEDDGRHGHGLGQMAPPPFLLGAFEVKGADRTVLLGVLRMLTVRKLDAAVKTMWNILRAKQAQQRRDENTEGNGSPVLHHIENMLDDLAKTIKQLQS